jgi:hypothetical protein
VCQGQLKKGPLAPTEKGAIGLERRLKSRPVGVCFAAVSLAASGRRAERDSAGAAFLGLADLRWLGQWPGVEVFAA